MSANGAGRVDPTASGVLFNVGSDEVGIFRCSECLQHANKVEDIKHGARWVDAPPGHVDAETEYKLEGSLITFPIIPPGKVKAPCEGTFPVERSPFRNDDGSERPKDHPDVVAFWDKLDH